MRDLTFFTTNATKLSHARYIAEGWPIRIKGFRQRTYHADYIEPRLSSREAILEASYLSAKQQIIKAGFSEHSHLFMLEDTSVRIDALSTSEHDVPGVDIKYWMREQTFDALDAMLRETHASRGVTVRSDVLLHIPSKFRSRWGIDDPYIVFVGEQRGTIIEREVPFDPNPVFPWLDDRSFNKWFEPEGCNGPLGSLSVEVADKVDFRRASFGKLFSFLNSKRYLELIPVQMEIPLEKRPNIVFCGYTCSGKTTASQYLARKYGYLHVEASDFMYLSYFYRHGYQGRIAIGDFAEKALKQKPTIAAEKVADYIIENLAEPIIISGFRAPEEIEHVSNILEVFGKQFIIKFVEADEVTRYQRMCARARPGDEITIEKFRNRDNQQRRMGLQAIEALRTASTLSNDSGVSSYLSVIDDIAGCQVCDEVDVTAGLGQLKSTAVVGLQDAIFIALLSVWSEDEARAFYTTTEIAKIAALVFPSVKPAKHKDNISRYFNQDYYAFYEISNSGGSMIRKYRLSNTGYGIAIRTLRSLLRSRITI